MGQLLQDYRKAIGDNPLRKWRNSYGVSIVEASTLLRVTTYTIQKWEQGSSVPNRENFAALERVTGKEDIKEKWNEWIAALPRA